MSYTSRVLYTLSLLLGLTTSRQTVQQKPYSALLVSSDSHSTSTRTHAASDQKITSAPAAGRREEEEMPLCDLCTEEITDAATVEKGNGISTPSHILRTRLKRKRRSKLLACTCECFLSRLYIISMTHVHVNSSVNRVYRV